jgi:iron complex transport system ATP-binding protein
MSARLVVSGLSVGYPGRAVVSDLTLPAFGAGTVTALVGPNAAGKTTLLRGMAGLARATGSIRVDGRELLGAAPQVQARYMAYMPQSLPQRVALTVYEAMLAALHASGAPPRGTPDADVVGRTLARLGIADLALRPLDRLSGGQRQLASLAQALARDPAVLLLDEPTSALDLRHQMTVMSTVADVAAERGIAAVVVLHDIALACRWCSRIVVLADGRAVADGPPETAITPETLARVYGVEARVERCSRGHMQIIADAPLTPDATGATGATGSVPAPNAPSSPV